MDAGTRTVGKDGRTTEKWTMVLIDPLAHAKPARRRGRLRRGCRYYIKRQFSGRARAAAGPIGRGALVEGGRKATIRRGAKALWQHGVDAQLARWRRRLIY